MSTLLAFGDFFFPTSGKEGVKLFRSKFCARLALLAFLLFPLIRPLSVFAGPPFRTDDPEPVEYRHWEVYLASQYSDSQDGMAMTAPHIEINYGVFPNVQLHLITPVVYAKPAGEPSHYGYGDTEVGIKYRFIQETERWPMVGVFPLVEVPTGDDTKGLGNGDPQVFLPLWLQKSWGPWTTYGGGGYWINPGTDHQNFWFIGWLIQREISENLTLGAEVFHQSPAEVDGDGSTGFNVGGIINFTENHHLLFSVGRDFAGPNLVSGYVAYQLTFGPEEKSRKSEQK